MIRMVLLTATTCTDGPRSQFKLQDLYHVSVSWHFLQRLMLPGNLKCMAHSRA